ncbi:hypothetical protein RDABS01_009743 [Bienertia sinuspersici]
MNLGNDDPNDDVDPMMMIPISQMMTRVRIQMRVCARRMRQRLKKIITSWSMTTMNVMMNPSGMTMTMMIAIIFLNFTRMKICMRSRNGNLFTDKQHLRDVLRDYCIQCGFSVIILSANNIKYTVSCATEGCAWRLHAGRLPDCMTWAIKSIQNFEHTCVGLESRNPMVNVKWATRVLLEDIRNHNETPKKALNEKLENKFGITICLSTLYRVRKRALMKIHGGHDVSYSHFVNGIENALANYWPKCDRRICCKHLSKNWKEKVCRTFDVQSFLESLWCLLIIYL